MLAGEIAETEQLLVIEIVADEVRLHVEDELPGQALCSRHHQLRLARLGLLHLEHVAAVDLLHGQKCGGHAAARVHELPAAQAEPLGVGIRQLQDPPLEALLRLALRRRKIFAVRYDLGRDRRRSRSRFGTRDEALFAFTEPGTHRHSSLLCLGSLQAASACGDRAVLGTLCAVSGGFWARTTRVVPACGAERIEEVVRTNFMGVLYGTRAFLPDMVERRQLDCLYYAPRRLGFHGRRRTCRC